MFKAHTFIIKQITAKLDVIIKIYGKCWKSVK